jgi:hypothetical protein
MNEATSPIISQMLSRLDEFTEEELIHLNRLIVERLRLMQQVRAHQTMTQFRIGQKVQFTANTGRVIVGMLTKYNRKSVTVVTSEGQTWTVSPSLLLSVTAR